MYSLFTYTYTVRDYTYGMPVTCIVIEMLYPMAARKIASEPVYTKLVLSCLPQGLKSKNR